MGTSKPSLASCFIDTALRPSATAIKVSPVTHGFVPNSADFRLAGEVLFAASLLKIPGSPLPFEKIVSTISSISFCSKTESITMLLFA